MGLPRLLYELQQIDLELQKKQEALTEFERQLGNTEALLKAKAELTSAQKQLMEVEAKQRHAEQELEDLEAKIGQLRDKLYSGKIKNPKELLSLERELEVLKRQLKQKEDGLLDLMNEVEITRDQVRTRLQYLKEVEEKWQKEQEVLTSRRHEIKEKLTELLQKRGILVSQIDSSTLQLYEQIKLRKGQAVAKVEQGRCQGCHLTLPVSEWQRVRTGMLVMCDNCGRILHLE